MGFVSRVNSRGQVRLIRSQIPWCFVKIIDHFQNSTLSIALKATNKILLSTPSGCCTGTRKSQKRMRGSAKRRYYRESKKNKEKVSLRLRVGS